MKKKRVCILSFSPICRDARVLRQIKYLSKHYDLNVIGYGEPPARPIENVQWHLLEIPTSPWITKLRGLTLLALGRLQTAFYDYWYWRKDHHRVALKMVTANKCDAYHANDWEALLVAAEAAKKTKARLVFDAHEYAPLELENRLYWKLLFPPMITYFLKKCQPLVYASVTVAPFISERYQKEFGLDSIVILNAPERMSNSFRNSDYQKIQLIHHGAAIRDRQLEKLIETMVQCDERYSLHFMLIHNDLGYLEHLKRLAHQVAPGRVTFHEPVPPEEIVRRISEFDMGFCFVAPTNYNYLFSLPNKFFDYVMAGLPVCIGPSPSMVDVVKKYGLGCVAPSFHPEDIANMLNGLTKDQLWKMRLASRKAAEEINAEQEMKKLVELYDRLFNPF